MATVAVAPPLLEAPSAIPGYLLEALIARRVGSWSVFRASDLVRLRPVAVTILGSHLNHDPDYGVRFEREMPQVARLGHPHLVPVLDAGRAPRGLYLVTELEDAVPLERALPDRVLDAESAIRLLGPIADALDHAHVRGLVHRGVAPESILLAESRHALLAYFALADPIAAGLDPDPAMLAYLAPELIEGGEASPRSDVYGLAATFAWVLTGTVPSSEFGEPLPVDLERVLRRSLAVDPSRRASSAGELVSELERVALPGRGGRVRARDGSRSGTAPDLPPVGPTPEGPTRPVHGGAAPARSATKVAPRRGRSRGRRQRRALLGVLGVAALASTAGSLVAARDADPPVTASERPLGAIASTRELALSVPASWSLADDVTEIGGLPLDESMQLLPSREGGGRKDASLLVGVVREADDRLLPPGFSSRVTTEPVGERVQVGRYAGYRYAGLVLRGTNQRINLYAVPTTEGAATIACVARPGAGDFLQRCEAVATTLELSGLEAKPLSPSSDYVAALDATLRRLNTRRRAGRAALRKARTPAGQARLADDLARAYATATAEHSRTSRRLGDPEADDPLVALFRDVRDAYAAVARGARTGSQPGFRAAAAAVARRERRLRVGLEELRRAGASPTA